MGIRIILYHSSVAFTCGFCVQVEVEKMRRMEKMMCGNETAPLEKYVCLL